MRKIKRPAGRPRKKETGKLRDRILAEALYVFSTSGVLQTGIPQIALRSGVDSRLVRHYFPTLEELFYSVVQLMLDQMRAETDRLMSKAENDSVVVFKNYVWSYFLWGEKNPAHASLFIQFYALASVSPKFAQLNNQIRDAGRTRILAMLTELGKQKVIKPTMSSKPKLVEGLQMLITGGAVAQHTEKRMAEESFQTVWSATQALLGIKD